MTRHTGNHILLNITPFPFAPFWQGDGFGGASVKGVFFLASLRRSLHLCSVYARHDVVCMFVVGRAHSMRTMVPFVTT